MEKIFAQSLSIDGGVTLNGPDNFAFTSLGGVVSSLTKYAFAIGGVSLLVMIIFAGYTLMTSAGDAKKMEAGKAQLTYAVVGFIIIVAAFWIVQIVGIAFGIDVIKETFGT